MFIQEVYFGFKKIEEVKQLYRDMRDNVDDEHTKKYEKALKLASDIGCEENMPRIIRRRQTRANPDIASPCDYWRVTNHSIP